MNKATVFISYHPQYLPDYVNLCRLDGNRSRHILALCRHTYLTQAIIEEYSPKFDAVVLLPDIGYDKNIPAGFMACAAFGHTLRTDLAKALEGIDSFNVISCCSAWLTVNAILSHLRRRAGFRALFTICEHIASRGGESHLRTMLASIYTAAFGLMPVYVDKIHGFFYKKNPWGCVLKFTGPYEEPDAPGAKAGVAVRVRRQARPPAVGRPAGMVIFYSDRWLDQFKSKLLPEERHRLMQEFVRRLGERYKDQEIICSPHPLDKGVPIEEMSLVKHGISDQSLMAQMYLQKNLRRVIACYSVSSSALLYSSSIGVPSYSLYKYLGYGGDEHLQILFENAGARKRPYLFNISELGEVGAVDDFVAMPVPDEAMDGWEVAAYAVPPPVGPVEGKE